MVWYLLRLNALLQRAHRCVARPHHIEGSANAMADDASRQWHLNDSELLTHFNLTYPQCTAWVVHHPTASMLSALNGAYSRNNACP